MKRIGFEEVGALEGASGSISSESVGGGGGRETMNAGKGEGLSCSHGGEIGFELGKEIRRKRNFLVQRVFILFIGG